MIVHDFNKLGNVRAGHSLCPCTVPNPLVWIYDDVGRAGSGSD